MPLPALQHQKPGLTEVSLTIKFSVSIPMIPLLNPLRPINREFSVYWILWMSIMTLCAWMPENSIPTEISRPFMTC